MGERDPQSADEREVPAYEHDRDPRDIPAERPLDGVEQFEVEPEEEKEGPPSGP